MNAWDSPQWSHLTRLERKLSYFWFKIDPTQNYGPVTGQLIGEMPGPNTRSYLPLYPYPKSSSGGRLMDLSGLDPGRYLARLRRRNLIEHRRSVWPMYEAIERAHEFLQEQPAQSRIILLGNNVGTAFLRAGLPLGKLFEIVNYKDSYYILIPHPSGINRAYNDPMVRVMANSVINFAADTLEIGTKLL